MADGSTRRDVLRIGGGLAMATTAALSGCLGILDGSGGGSGPAYADWLATPDAFGSSHYEFGQFGVATFREHRDQLNETVASALADDVKTAAEPLGFASDGVDWYLLPTSQSLSSGPVAVLGGSFDPASVADRLASSGFERRSKYQGYRILEETDGPRVVGVGGDAAVVVRSGSEPLATLKTVVDVGSGDEARYGATNEDLGYALERLGDGLVVKARTTDRVESSDPENDDPHFAGQVASGARIDVDGDTATLYYLIVYESTDAIDREPVRQWIRADGSAGGAFERYGDVKLGRDGRALFLKGTRPAKHLFLQ